MLYNTNLVQIMVHTTKFYLVSIPILHDYFTALVDIKTSILPKYRSQMQILLFDGARAHTCHDSQAFM